MIYDVCIIGGGINGTGIARDLAGRGLKVILLEKDDLGEGTSSRSTKLIHGGLRYLETYNFKLVRESLQERARLLKLAPHVIWPMRFVLPHVPSLRPRAMIRAGLFLYDHLALRGGLPSSQAIRFSGGPLKAGITHGFEYADCWVDDARLVVLNAIDARAKGANILTRTKCVGLQQTDAGWTIKTPMQEFSAKLVVNAAGPWVGSLINSILPKNTVPKLKLSKGSHIIVPRIHTGSEAYMLQQPDGRIVFAIPYEDRFTLIGTTDVIVNDDPEKAECSEDEKRYLINAANTFFEKQINTSDIVHTYAGVRPLLDDGQDNISKVSRDYKVHTQLHGTSPLITLIGGKLTTFRTVSEHVANVALEILGKKAVTWTESVPLPGGDIDHFEDFLSETIKKYTSLPPVLLMRYARAYGTRMFGFINGDMGRDFGDGVFEAELNYLRREEWAQTAQDVFWRRSKLGLHISADTKEKIEAYFK